MSAEGKFEIEGAICVGATAKAIRVRIDERELWVPQSVVDDDSEVWKDGDTGMLIVKEWFAIKEGLA
jgi:hypothetical protein